MLILLYFTEGIVRATTDHGLGQGLAIGEAVLSLFFFAATVTYARQTRSAPLPPRS